MWDARDEEVKWLSTFQPAATRVQKFLRRFLDKVITVSPKLFEYCILAKSMPLYLRMHLQENPFIDVLPRGRPNRYIRHSINSDTNPTCKCYLDRLKDFLSTKLILL